MLHSQIYNPNLTTTTIALPTLIDIRQRTTRFNSFFQARILQCGSLGVDIEAGSFGGGEGECEGGGSQKGGEDGVEDGELHFGGWI